MFSGIRHQFFQLQAPRKMALKGEVGVRELKSDDKSGSEHIVQMSFRARVIENVFYAGSQGELMLQSCLDQNKMYDTCDSLPIDLYCPPFDFFQMMVKHDGKNVVDWKTISIICSFVTKTYGPDSPVNLYFVVPADSFDMWNNMQAFPFVNLERVNASQCEEDKGCLRNLKQFVYKYEV